MTDDLELRASDADRDHAAAVLGGALATGRLTSAEHAEWQHMLQPWTREQTSGR